MTEAEAMFLKVGGGDTFVSSFIGENMKAIVANGWAVKTPQMCDTDYHQFEVTDAGRKVVGELQKRADA